MSNNEKVKWHLFWRFFSLKHGLVVEKITHFHEKGPLAGHIRMIQVNHYCSCGFMDKK